MVNIKLDELVRVENWDEAKRNSKGYSEIELIVDLENQFCNDIEARLSDLSKKDRSKIESNRLTHLLIAWKFAIPESTPSVIADIGGGNGYFFDWIRRFTNTQNISWKIFESPEICKAYSPHADILEILLPVRINAFKFFKLNSESGMKSIQLSFITMSSSWPHKFMSDGIRANSANDTSKYRTT